MRKCIGPLILLSTLTGSWECISAGLQRARWLLKTPGKSSSLLSPHRSTVTVLGPRAGSWRSPKVELDQLWDRIWLGPHPNTGWQQWGSQISSFGTWGHLKAQYNPFALGWGEEGWHLPGSSQGLPVFPCFNAGETSFFDTEFYSDLFRHEERFSARKLSYNHL